MRAGQVVRIRVAPKDCLSVIDVLQKAGINTTGMSFSSVVSLALSSLLEGIRKGGVIPDRDGFEFQEMMQPYLNNAHTRKVGITNAIYSAGGEFTAPAVAVTPEPKPVSTEERLARRRLSELVAKREAIDDGAPMVWQESDETEYQELYFKVYGERP